MNGRVEALEMTRRDLKPLDRLLDYVIVLIGIVISLAIVGWTSLLYSALTAAGLFSVIIGLAVKDVAANFVSGVLIIFDQPFVPGDYIKIREFAGTVTDVSLRATTIASLDGPIVRIPNSLLTTEPTINYSMAAQRRIAFTISIASGADIRRALQIIESVLAGEKGLLAEPAPTVLVQGVREYAVDIQAIAHAPKNTFIELGSELRRQVTNALHQAGVELAVPTRKNVNLPVAAE
jgi:small conductance mechanosensitive channel